MVTFTDSDEFGDFEQTQDTTVFLAKIQRNVVVHVKLNAWN
jgi:hypothetical protein